MDAYSAGSPAGLKTAVEDKQFTLKFTLLPKHIR